jgi:starvation-inducible DNA-binding protein
MFTNGASKGDLAKHLSVILSDLVVYKFTAHGFHWNVKGPHFSEFHKLFGKLYEDAEGAIDPTAENVRKLGFDSIFLLGDFLGMSSYEPRVVVGDPIEMSAVLYEMNQNFCAHLVPTIELATSIGEHAIANFLADRLGVHQKYSWQLGTIIGADAMSISSME